MNPSLRTLKSKIKKSCVTVSLEDTICFRDKEQQSHWAMKPNGLWYSVGAEWIEWCLNEGCQEWLEKKFIYQLFPNYDNILRITMDSELLSFAEEYTINKNEDILFSHINWKKVAEDFSGMEIAPYNWKKRLDIDYLWYYGWDVASGCIWQSGGIIDIRNTGIKLSGIVDIP